MDLYTKNQAQKERRAKRRTEKRFDRYNSIAYLRRIVQTDHNPVLEQRLQELERRDSQEIPTRSRKIYWGQEKNRLYAERAREENTRLMYRLLPGERDEIEQLAPRTFLHEGILYRLKRNSDDLRVYANKVGDKSKVIVRGNIADLEAVVKELRGVHNTLVDKERVRQVPNPPKPTFGFPNYLRTVVKEDGEDNDEEEVVDCGYLVPTFSYVSPALQALGVKPVVVGFQRVDAYGKPVAVRNDYGLGEGEQADDKTALPEKRSSSRAKKYLSLVAGITFALANVFSNGIPQGDNQPAKMPPRDSDTQAASSNNGKTEVYITNSGGIREPIPEIRNLSEPNVIYSIDSPRMEGGGLLEQLYFIKNSNE